MNPTVELNLTLILFLPWLLILGWVYAVYPKSHRGRARRVFDAITLAASLAAFLASVYWSFIHADPFYGRMWKQILATALSYGVFLAVLGAAFAIRTYWFARTRSQAAF